MVRSTGVSGDLAVPKFPPKILIYDRQAKDQEYLPLFFLNTIGA
jgi:hypothetical protein